MTGKPQPADPVSSVRIELFDGPRIFGPNGPLELSPFQTALLALVFTEGEISRLEVAQVLWGEDADARIRKRIRQLVHTVGSRLGGRPFDVRGDMLGAARGLKCDVRTFEDHVREGRYSEAAHALEPGFMNRPLPAVSDTFDDWRTTVEKRLRLRVERAAHAAWAAATTSGDRVSGREAAEALYALHPNDPEMVGRIIEARARVGRMQAAEIAWAEYLDRVGREGPAQVVEEAIGRVRAAFGRTPADQAQDQVPFVGRQPYVTRLEGVVRQVRDGYCSYALILGEAGIGKTRLLDEVARSAALDGVRCLTATPVELERRISLNPIIDALSGVDVDRHLTDLGEPWRTVVGATLPRGSLSQPVSAPPPIEDDALSRRLLDAFSLLLESVSREQPTILFIDDLHWADATTVAALHFFRRRRERVPFGLVATVRPDMVGGKDPLDVLLSDEKGFPFERVGLGALEESEGREILGHIGDQRLSTDATEKLLALSGMHPLYLTELARDFLAGRLELPESRSEALTLPISLRQILASRTEALSATATKVAQVLSVGSKPMRIGDLGRLLDRRFDELVDSVDELRHGGLAQLERDRVWIAHDLFKSAIYSEMSDTRRALLHASLAELIARSGSDEQSGELAIHFDRAGEASLAARHGWIAGERAMIQGAIAEAAYHFELVARNEDNPRTKAEATANYALAYHLARKMKRANPALELAASRLREVGLPQRARRMDILRVEGLAEDGDTPIDEIVARLSKIKAEARGAEDWEAVALALDVELRVQNSLGNLDHIHAIFDEMQAIAQRAGDDTAAVCHLGLAMGAVFGDPEKAARSAHRALVLTETVRHHRLKALWRYLVVQNHQGRLLLETVSPFIEEARELAARTGDVKVRFSIESNLAVALLDAGELDKAEYMLDASTPLLGSGDMDINRLNQANNYAELALLRGDYHVARERFKEAESYFGSATSPDVVSSVTAGIGLSAFEMGDLTEARRREEEMGPVLRPWTCDPTIVVTLKVRVLERQRRHEEALTVLEALDHIVRDRFHLAWLKINALRADRMIKWGYRDSAIAIAEQCSLLATELGLHRHEAAFLQLAERAKRNR